MHDCVPYDPIEGQGQGHKWLKATQEESTVSPMRTNFYITIYNVQTLNIVGHYHIIWHVFAHTLWSCKDFTILFFRICQLKMKLV